MISSLLFVVMAFVTLLAKLLGTGSGAWCRVLWMKYDSLGLRLRTGDSSGEEALR